MYSVDSTQCQLEHFNETRPAFKLHSSFNCFKGFGSATCKGDGGSPIVCPIETGAETFMQVSLLMQIYISPAYYYHHRASQNIIDITFLVGHNGMGGSRM